MSRTMAVTLAVAVLALAGCASSGNLVLKDETQKTVAQKIRKGHTTEADIRKIYGDPMETRFTDSGNEIWEYDFVKAHAKAANYIPIVNMFGSGAVGDKKQLVIMFNKDGVVKNYSMSTSKVEENTGLFQ
ncbi:MAG TPA: outer membrane protein assembly factor BamE [Mariprofundaceae bacterium]|nr:outer membrane protein assembly factor BamE [Mariprofundaceae bacterium]